MRFVNKITREGKQISGGREDEEDFGYRNGCFDTGWHRAFDLFHV